MRMVPATPRSAQRFGQSGVGQAAGEVAAVATGLHLPQRHLKNRGSMAGQGPAPQPAAVVVGIEADHLIQLVLAAGITGEMDAISLMKPGGGSACHEAQATGRDRRRDRNGVMAPTIWARCRRKCSGRTGGQERGEIETGRPTGASDLLPICTISLTPRQGRPSELLIAQTELLIAQRVRRQAAMVSTSRRAPMAARAWRKLDSFTSWVITTISAPAPSARA